MSTTGWIVFALVVGAIVFMMGFATALLLVQEQNKELDKELQRLYDDARKARNEETQDSD